MCWVIPPASVSTTFALRIASSSVVLPWSTWPMIVTTGGRGDEVGRVVLVRLGLVLLVVGVLDRDLALQLGGEKLDLVVGQRLRRGLQRAEGHEDLDDVLHPDAERLREVADGDAGRDRDRAGRGTTSFGCFGTAAAAALVARAAAVRARTGGTGVDDDTAPARPGPRPGAA